MIRVHDKPLEADEAEPQFDRDVTDGIRVHCSVCGAETLILRNDLMPRCLGLGDDADQGCGRIFVYRPWWEW